jgi:hypothetical protein
LTTFTVASNEFLGGGKVKAEFFRGRGWVYVAWYGGQCISTR